MALALPRELRVTGLMDDLLAVANGAVNGYLIDHNVMAMLLLNLSVLAVDKLGLFKVPEGLVKSSEGFLGLVLYAILKGGVK